MKRPLVHWKSGCAVSSAKYITLSVQRWPQSEFVHLVHFVRDSGSHVRRVFWKRCRNSCWPRKLPLTAFPACRPAHKNHLNTQLTLKMVATGYLWSFLVLKMLQPIVSPLCVAIYFVEVIVKVISLNRRALWRTGTLWYNPCLSSAACC